MRLICEIAAEIRADWDRINGSASAYLDAMDRITRIDDDYGLDSAREVVLRFLSVANTWKGPTARTIKAELNAKVPKRKM